MPPTNWTLCFFIITNTSSSGQKDILLNDTSNFIVGMPIHIFDGTNEEYGIIDSIADNISITLKDNLINSYSNPHTIENVFNSDTPSHHYGYIYITGDETSHYNIRMKVKYKQGTDYQYGIINDIHFSNGKTIILIYCGTDYSLQNLPFTDIHCIDNGYPDGFPFDANKWSIIFSDINIHDILNPIDDTWYNPTGIELNISVGEWLLQYVGKSKGINNLQDDIVDMHIALSTSDNSLSDPDLETISSSVSINQTIDGIWTVKGFDIIPVQLTEETKYYLIIKVKSINSSFDKIYLDGEDQEITIKATSPYLIS